MSYNDIIELPRMVTYAESMREFLDFVEDAKDFGHVASDSNDEAEAKVMVAGIFEHLEEIKKHLDAIKVPIDKLSDWRVDWYGL